MRVVMPSISDPGFFTYDPENPTKYTEACSHAIHQILYTLSQAGFEIVSDAGNVFHLEIARDRDFDELTVMPLESFDGGF
jgi:hypothetical protein